MLSHAHGVLLEKCTQVITANKSLSIANSTTEATLNFLRSEVGVLKSETVAAENALSFSRSSNGSLRSRNAKLLEKIASLTTANKSLEAANTTLHHEKQAADQEYATASEERGSALKDAQDSRQRIKELQEFKRQYESSQTEMKELKDDQRKLKNLQTSFDALSVDHNQAKSQVEKLQEELVGLRKHPATIKKQEEELKNAEGLRQKLEDQLLQANARGARVEELERALRVKNESISSLQRQLEAMKEVEQQLKESTTEINRLSKELETLEEKDQEIQQLREETGRITDLSQELKTQKEEIQAKVQVINDLRQQLELSQPKGQPTAQKAGAGEARGLDEFFFASQESDISFLQSQKRPDGGALLTAPGAQAKQRRVADRSGMAPKPRTRTLDPPEPSQTSLNAFVDFVRDSQQGPVIENVGDGPKVGRRSLATSPLTQLDSDEIAALSPDSQEEESQEPEIPETVPMDLIVVDAPDSQRSSPSKRGNSLVRPSSAMTDDLFKQHARNLEAASSFGSRSYLPEVQDSLLRHGHPMSTERSTIDPQDLILPPYTTPRHQNKANADRSPKTPAPQGLVSAIPVSGGSSTGIRHHPNSAVKRKAEGPTSPAKRTRLNPANYDNLIIPTPKPSALKQMGSGRSSAGPSRRVASGSSIVGTSAPAPGRTQKAVKPKRKNSRNDKYEKQFNGAT
jgi:hypothetical protein